MENCPYEGVNNYDEREYYIHMHSALALIDRYEKEFPDYMRRIFIEHDIMFKKTLKMIETIKLSKSLYFETLAPCIEYKKEFIYVCEILINLCVEPGSGTKVTGGQQRKPT